MQPSSAPHSDGEPEDHRHTKPKLNQPFFSFTNHNQNHTIHPYFNHSLKMFQPSINSFPKRTNPLLGDLKPKIFLSFSLLFFPLPIYRVQHFFFTQITLTKNHRSVPLQLTNKDDILQYEIQPQVNHSKEINTQKKKEKENTRWRKESLKNYPHYLRDLCPPNQIK